MITVRAKLIDISKIIERDYFSPRSTARLLSNIFNYYQYRYPDNDIEVEIAIRRKNVL